MPQARVPKGKRRVPPKVRKYRAELRRINQELMETATKHIHATQRGEIARGPPPAAPAPPFPHIAGMSDVRLQLEMQELHQEMIVSRWSVYGNYAREGIAPREVTTTGMTLTTMEDERVARQVSFFDAPTLYEQMRPGS